MHKKIRSLVLASLITISSTGQIMAIPQNYDNKETKEIVNEDISNQSTEEDKTVEDVSDKKTVKDSSQEDSDAVTKATTNKEHTIINSENTKIINVEGTSYFVVQLESGSLDNTQFTLNGQKVNPTPVNDSKTLVKFEVNPQEIAKVDIIQNDKTDSITLNKDGKEFTRVIENEDPDKVLVSGPLSAFDYYISNYDKDGKVRILPSKTTFNTVNEGEEEADTTVPRLTSERTKMGNDIEINVDTTFSGYQEWLNNIYSVEKVYDGNSSSTALQYSIKNGKVVIDADSKALVDLNQVHKIRIKAKGYNNAYVDIEIVKEAGQMQLSSDFNYWAYNELLFELKDFNYAITNPIYQVSLDGNVLTGDCVDYHIVSNLVRLENGALSKLTEGKHTLVVKAYGYEDYTRTFYLEKAPNGSSNPSLNDASEQSVNSYDGITTASAGGSSSGGSSAGGTTAAVRGNLIYDFDLLANAFILRNLDMPTKYSTEVLSYWNAMTKDAILTKDSKKMVDYQNYKNKINESYEGDYFTFKEYYNSLKESDYKGSPYTIKYILEDGLLGDIQFYAEESAKTAPLLTAEKQEDKIVITYDADSEYTSKIENLTVNSTTLHNYMYKVSDGKIVIEDTSNFSKGINEVSITADGYKTNRVKVDLSEDVSDLIAQKDKDGNVFIKLDSKFKKNLNGLSLNGKTLLDDSQAGDGDCYYIGDTLVLKSKLFDEKQNELQTLILSADGYNSTIVKFTPSKLESAEVEKLEVPSFVKLSKSNTYKTNGNVVIAVAQVFEDDYRKAITEVDVDGQKVDYTSASNELYSIQIGKENFSKAKEYEITIKATNYEDYTVKINVEGEDVSQQPDEENKNAQDLPTISVDKDLWGKYTFTTDESQYIDSLTKVTLNGEELTANSSQFASEGYYKGTGKIVILQELKGGDIITFKSDSYKDYTYKVPMKSVEKVTASKNSDGNYYFSSSDYNWTDDVKVYVNGEQLTKDTDYTANYGKVTILKELKMGDKVEIKSTGYDDYSYEVALFENKVSLSYSTYYDRYTFNSTDYNWANAIKSVKINGQEIALSTSFMPEEGYKTNYSGGIEIYSPIGNGDVVEIKAQGYKDYVFKNTTLNAKDIEIEVNGDLNLMKDVTAIDTNKTDITNKIQTEGEVDVTTPGVYQVIYKVKDSNGKTITKEINVTVKDKQAQNVKVTFDADNGQDLLVKEVAEGEALDYAPEAPVKEGYTFVGWYKDVDDITTEYQNNAKYTENVAYKAKYAHVTMLGAQGKTVVNDKSGIRFGTKIYTNEDKIVKKGTLIIPANLLKDGEKLTLDTPNAVNSVANALYEVNEKQNYVVYLGTLVNIPRTQFGRQITATAYVVYQDKNGNEYTVYAEYPNRSISVSDLNVEK